MTRVRVPAVTGLETSLRMQGDSGRARGAACPGVYDVYDASGFKMSSLLRDVSATRALAGLMSDGEAHYPENLNKAFVVNAPSMASVLWRVVGVALSAETRAKVQISTRVPKELEEALGGPEAVEAMMASVPPRAEE